MLQNSHKREAHPWHQLPSRSCTCTSRKQEALLRRQPVTLEGRLPPEALRQLFHLQADAEGGGVDISGHHNIAK